MPAEAITPALVILAVVGAIAPILTALAAVVAAWRTSGAVQAHATSCAREMGSLRQAVADLCARLDSHEAWHARQPTAAPGYTPPVKENT